MRLKQITFSEFLSFKDPTTISEFSPETNVVVGKNGSGKSNILSAVRFVFPQDSRCSSEERRSYFYEGNQMGKQTAFVEIVFDNASGRFPAGPTFTVRRTIDFKKDELTLDGKVVTKEELGGLLESAGFSRSNLFFIVPQGEVERLSLINDSQRYLLIKEVSGAAMYERDRVCFVRQLEETVQIEKKISLLKEKISERIRTLRDEQKMLLEMQTLDDEKNSIERLLLERELETLNTEIKAFQVDGSGGRRGRMFDLEDGQEGLKNIRAKIKGLLDEKSELLKRAGAQRETRYSTEECEKMRKELESLSSAEKKESESIKKLDDETESLCAEIAALEHEKIFLEANLRRKEPFSPTEVADCEEKLDMYGAKLKEEKGEDVGEVFSQKNFQDLVNERKMLWIEERSIDRKMRKATEELRQAENSIISASGSSYQALKTIKGESGVHGCVYELVSVPEELFLAVSATVGRNFFSVVVENDVVATNMIKKIDGRLTFIPLNRIRKVEDRVIEDDNMIPLWEQINSEGRYRDMLRFLTSNTYLVSDIKYATTMAKSYNVNVVTLEGEYISKSGTISGGYESKKNVFGDFKRVQKRISQLGSEKNGVAQKIRRVSDRIGAMQISKETGGGERRLDTRSMVIFLRKKMGFLKKGVTESSLRKARDEKERLEIKKGRVELEKNNRLSSVTSRRNRMRSLRTRIEQAREDMEAMRVSEQVKSIEDEVGRLRKEERETMNLINKENTSFEWKEEDLETKKKLLHKSLLLEKKGALMQRISALEGAPGPLQDKYSQVPHDRLIGELKRLCLEKKRFKGVNPKASLQLKELEMQQNHLVSRIQELQMTRGNIEEFVEELDHRKESSINLTFSMVCDNFAYYFSRMCPGLHAILVKSGEEIGIQLDGQRFSGTKVLSGGQKAVLALSLIFSIQKIDPSSFYIFDEIDANLDQQTRTRLCDLIKELGSGENASQFVFTTFKGEMLESGKKFFGVSFKDKKSSVQEISRVDAERFLSDEAGPER